MASLRVSPRDKIIHPSSLSLTSASSGVQNENRAESSSGGHTNGGVGASSKSEVVSATGTSVPTPELTQLPSIPFFPIPTSHPPSSAGASVPPTEVPPAQSSLPYSLSVSTIISTSDPPQGSVSVVLLPDNSQPLSTDPAQRPPFFTEITTTVGGIPTTITSQNPTALSTNLSSSSTTSGDRTAIIAGTTVSVFFLLLVSLAAVFLYRRRKLKLQQGLQRLLQPVRSRRDGSGLLNGEDFFDEEDERVLAMRAYHDFNSRSVTSTGSSTPMLATPVILNRPQDVPVGGFINPQEQGMVSSSERTTPEYTSEGEGTGLRLELASVSPSLDLLARGESEDSSVYFPIPVTDADDSPAQLLPDPGQPPGLSPDSISPMTHISSDRSTAPT